MGLQASPLRHWNIAECSLSTGSMGTLCVVHKVLMICPATTSVSLLANAMALPALIAAMVGRKPAKPTMAVSTMSICVLSTTWHRASGPAYTFIGRSDSAWDTVVYLSSLAMTTVSGLNSRACFINSSAYCRQWGCVLGIGRDAAWWHQALACLLNLSIPVWLFFHVMGYVVKDYAMRCNLLTVKTG